jgi:hypothetical protein
MTKDRKDVIKYYHLAFIVACTALGIISLEGADYLFISVLRQIRLGEHPSAAIYALTTVPFCIGFLSLFFALGFGSYITFRAFFKP